MRAYQSETCTLLCFSYLIHLSAPKVTTNWRSDGSGISSVSPGPVEMRGGWPQSSGGCRGQCGGGACQWGRRGLGFGGLVSEQNEVGSSIPFLDASYSVFLSWICSFSFVQRALPWWLFVEGAWRDGNKLLWVPHSPALFATHSCTRALCLCACGCAWKNM